MEDLAQFSDVEQAAFCVELAKRLNMLRRQDRLCDVTLVTKDDKEFKAHRNQCAFCSKPVLLQASSERHGRESTRDCSV